MSKTMMWKQSSCKMCLSFCCLMSSPIIIETSQKDCKIWAFGRHIQPLKREGSLSCHTCCDT